MLVYGWLSSDSLAKGEFDVGGFLAETLASQHAITGTSYSKAAPI
jgi:hypothetical protein